MHSHILLRKGGGLPGLWALLLMAMHPMNNESTDQGQLGMLARGMKLCIWLASVCRCSGSTRVPSWIYRH
jgi:hypothetical protein